MDLSILLINNLLILDIVREEQVWQSQHETQI